MPRRPDRSNRPAPAFDRLETRSLMTLVFLFNGNSFRAARPGPLTHDAAEVLRAAGHQAVEVGTPAIRSGGSIAGLQRQLVRMAHGQTVGLVGFSSGGALALRLASTPGLKVAAVLDDYGVPDVRAFLARKPPSVNPVVGLAPFKPSVVDPLSGPVGTSAHVVAAFGARDPHVEASTSRADLLVDDPDASVYAYDGGHGAKITASRPALDDFLAHLG